MGLMVILLELRNISKTIGNEVVLNNIDLAVKPGSLIVVRGRSGVGKTTLAKIASLLLRPDHGEIIFRDQNITNESDRYWSMIRLKYIGYIDQFFKLITSFTVLENVELPLALLGVNKSIRVKKALEVLSELGLKNKAYRYPLELSGGERQRVAIARAIVKNPVLIIGDEPLSNLDEDTASMVLSIFRKLSIERKVGILITTTDLYYEFNADKDYILINNKLIINR